MQFLLITRYSLFEGNGINQNMYYNQSRKTLQVIIISMVQSLPNLLCRAYRFQPVFLYKKKAYASSNTYKFLKQFFCSFVAYYFFILILLPTLRINFCLCTNLFDLQNDCSKKYRYLFLLCMVMLTVHLSHMIISILQCQFY